MKKIITLFLIAVLGLGSVSCNKFDDGRPSSGLREKFEKMYPDAHDIEWEWEGIFWEVSFEIGVGENEVEYEAYYFNTGEWIGTMTEIALAAVPQKIVDYLQGSEEYGSVTFADFEVEFWQTLEFNYYRFTVWHEGRQVQLDVSETGQIALVRDIYSSL